MDCKTIFYKFGEVVRLVVMCKTQTLNQSLQQTNVPTVSSKANALLIATCFIIICPALGLPDGLVTVLQYLVS